MTAPPLLSTNGQIVLAEEPAFCLGSVTVEPALCRVEAAVAVQLEPRVMQVLVALAAAAPHVVSRDTLIERCWQGRIVGDDAINRAIGSLRKLAREHGGGTFSIETLKKIGFRLTGLLASREGPDASRAESARHVPPASQWSAAPAIAVLPFSHPAGDMDQAYFAEGMAEEIIAGIAQGRTLRVISPLSSLGYRVAGASAAQICEDLGVRYLVRGQVRRMAARLRLIVQVIDGQTDETIWSERYERPIDDLFAVQDEVAAGVIAAIEPAVLGHEQMLARKRSSGVEFWDLFIRARYHFWKSSIPDFRTAASLLGQALELKPDDAAALSLLSLVELSKVWAGGHPDPAGLIARAHSKAQDAVAADNRNPAAHHALGIVLAQLGQHEQAMAAQRRSLQLNPYNPQAQGELARLMAFGRGPVEEVLALSDAALLASPTDPHDWLWLRSRAIALFLAGRSDEALESARAASARRPDYFFLHLLVAVCASAAGERQAARIACAQGQAMNPSYNFNHLKLGHPFVYKQDLERFAAALRETGWPG